jgi:glycosyltransferase involved in cell wall biosynthesis
MRASKPATRALCHRLVIGLLLLTLPASVNARQPAARRGQARRVEPIRTLAPSRPGLSIVFPAHNEARYLPTLIREWSRAAHAAKRGFELVVVNDGSTDNTRSVLRRLRRQVPALTVVNLEQQVGQTRAILAGFKRARADIVAYSDADGQINPSSLGPLLAKIDQGYDLVNGRRRLARSTSRSIALGSYAMNKIRQLITGDHLRDGASGFKIMRRSVIDQLPGPDRFPKLHRFFAPIAAMQGFKVTEVDIAFRDRSHGRGHYRALKRLWEYAARDFPALLRYRSAVRAASRGQQPR